VNLTTTMIFFKGQWYKSQLYTQLKAGVSERASAKRASNVKYFCPIYGISKYRVVIGYNWYKK